MAIKNTKMGGTDWTSGATLTYTDLNDTFDVVPVLASTATSSSGDVVSASVAASTGANGDSGYSTKRTISFAAGAVKNKILIKGDVMAGVNLTNIAASGAYSGTAYVQLTIDSTQKFEMSVGASQSYDGSNVYVPNSTPPIRGWVFQYTPTAGEKSSGFTLDLDLKVTGSTTGAGNQETAYAYNSFWEVWSV